MPEQECMVVRETGKPDNDFWGGYTDTYQIISCDISDEKGELVFSRRSFQSVPDFRPPEEQRLEPRKEHSESRGPITRQVRDMDKIDSEIIEELRERGVEISILPKLPKTYSKAPASK